MAARKLAGVISLTETQWGHLLTAYTLQKANGHIRASSSAMRSGLKTLERFQLVARRANAGAVYDLTATGLDLAQVLEERREERRVALRAHQEARQAPPVARAERFTVTLTAAELCALRGALRWFHAFKDETEWYGATPPAERDEFAAACEAISRATVSR